MKLLGCDSARKEAAEEVDPPYYVPEGDWRREEEGGGGKFIQRLTP